MAVSVSASPKPDQVCDAAMQLKRKWRQDCGFDARTTAQPKRLWHCKYKYLSSSLLVVFLLLITAPAEAQVSSECKTLSGNSVISRVLEATQQAAGFLQAREDICKTLAKYLNTPPQQLVLTSTRKGAIDSVCITTDPKAACVDIIADVEKGAIASEALQFAYSNSLEETGPQKQTVERLFIRPATMIR